MTPELLHTLLRWLTSDNDVERRHAEWRLSQPDVLTPIPRPVESPIAHAPLGKCCG